MPTVLVRNTEKGPLVFSDLAENIELEWFGNGDPEGRDLQRVPQKVFENPNFLRTLDRGSLVVEDATEEIQGLLDAQNQGRRDREAKAAAAIEDSMDRETEQTIVTAEIDESGKLISQEITESQAQGEIETNTEGIPLAVPASSEELDEEGKPKETTIPVVMGPREKG